MSRVTKSGYFILSKRDRLTLGGARRIITQISNQVEAHNDRELYETWVEVMQGDEAMVCLSSLLDVDDPPDEERDRASMEMELEHMRQSDHVTDAVPYLRGRSKK